MRFTLAFLLASYILPAFSLPFPGKRKAGKEEVVGQPAKIRKIDPPGNQIFIYFSPQHYLYTEVCDRKWGLEFIYEHGALEIKHVIPNSQFERGFIEIGVLTFQEAVQKENIISFMASIVGIPSHEDDISNQAMVKTLLDYFTHPVPLGTTFHDELRNNDKVVPFTLRRTMTAEDSKRKLFDIGWFGIPSSRLDPQNKKAYDVAVGTSAEGTVVFRPPSSNVHERAHVWVKDQTDKLVSLKTVPSDSEMQHIGFIYFRALGPQNDLDSITERFLNEIIRLTPDKSRLIQALTLLVFPQSRQQHRTITDSSKHVEIELYQDMPGNEGDLAKFRTTMHKMGLGNLPKPSAYNEISISGVPDQSTTSN